MKKDIPFYPVQNVLLAIAKLENGLAEAEWAVYFLNKNDFPLENVMVTSKGYGTMNGVSQETSVLRHFLGMVPANSHIKIEPIDPALFHLFNEYWISYYIDKQIFDKKFVFVPGSVSDNNLIFIKQLNLEGILHK